MNNKSSLYKISLNYSYCGTVHKSDAEKSVELMDKVLHQYIEKNNITTNLDISNEFWIDLIFLLGRKQKAEYFKRFIENGCIEFVGKK